MRKTFYFLFLVSLLSSVFNAYSQNAGITSISSATTCPGTVITLNITQTSMVSISGVGLRLDYDAAVLSFINPNPSSLPGNFYNTNPALYASGNDFTAVQTNADVNTKNLSMYWTSTSGGGVIPTDVAGVATMLSLSFWYYGGNTSIVFNTTALYGQACEWNDGATGDPLNDIPPSTYYIDGSITQGPAPTASVITGSAAPCQGTEIYSIVNVYGVNYTWTNTANFTGSSTSDSITYTIDGTSIPGNIILTPSNTCGVGTPVSLEITSIAVPSVAATSASVSATNICSGVTTTLSFTDGTLGDIATWNWYSVSCGGTTEGQGTTLDVAPTATTTYYVRAEGQCNTTTCVTIEVAIKPIPSIASITGTVTPIIGSTEIYSAPVDVNVDSYAWTIPSGWAGTSTTDSISCTVGIYSGYIIATPTNNCGTGLPTSIYVSTGYTVSGNFTYNNGSSTALDSIWVFLNQNSIKIDSIQADVNGYYEFNQVFDGGYTITATTHKAWGGVNVTDAIKVKRHFAGAEYFTSSVKIHTADVNRSYAINVTDAVKITRRFAGSDTSFTRGDWNFEKPTGGDTIYVSPTLNDSILVNGSDITADFKGMCVGDVNGSFNPSKSTAKLVMNYNGIKNLNSNQYFELPIKVSSDLSVGAISLILNYPKDLISISNVQLLNNNKYEDLYFTAKGSELRIGWLETNGAINMNENTYLIVKIKTNNNFKPGNVINFTVANNDLCEFANENGDVYNNVNLNTYSIECASKIDNINLNNNISIYPNPANDVLNIEYDLTNNGLVKISLYNVLGEKVSDIVNNSQVTGTYKSNVDLSSLSSGIYTLNMSVDGINLLNKKIIINK